MKNQFEKVKKLARKYREEAEKLDRMIEDIYGFSYPDTDYNSRLCYEKFININIKNFWINFLIIILHLEDIKII
ncbi:hypothetical protein RIU14_05005 [Riemerella anatipestifer]|uniref:hypothetical protein n=1 Tax=Riemerella anatipestifer TaxID=34085 RepID=UPI00069B9106|nr:hypothetical protein [Riemerella anatipestifer]MDR7694127.1 hypothetical protein [Riemerella anatipestifer]